MDGISGPRILRSIKRLRSQAFSSRRRLTSATDASRFGNSLSVLLKSEPYPYAPLFNFKMIAHCRPPSCAGGETRACNGKLRALACRAKGRWFLVAVTANLSQRSVLGRPLARCGDRRAIFTRPNRQRFYFQFTVNCENRLDGAFDSETRDAQERLLSSGNSSRPYRVA